MHLATCTTLSVCVDCIHVCVSTTRSWKRNDFILVHNTHGTRERILCIIIVAAFASPNLPPPPSRCAFPTGQSSPRLPKNACPLSTSLCFEGRGWLSKSPSLQDSALQPSTKFSLRRCRCRQTRVFMRRDFFIRFFFSFLLSLKLLLSD